LTDQRRRFRRRPRLNGAAHDRRAGANSEFLEFIEGFFGVERRWQGGAPPGPGTAGPFDADQNRTFVGGLRLRRAYASGDSWCAGAPGMPAEADVADTEELAA
jgi:hypothetical protein